MSEEAEALVHASKGGNKVMMSLLTLSLILIVSLIEWGVICLVIDGFEEPKYWIGMLMDSASVTFPYICLGIYSKLPFHLVQILASLPFLLMIFLSTTFSPGSGLAGLKGMRYLFPRFYFWCMVPDVQDSMEGCPENHTVLYMCLSAFIGLGIFLFSQLVSMIQHAVTKKAAHKKMNAMKDEEFVNLQIELYGEEVLTKESLSGTAHSMKSRNSEQNNEEAIHAKI